MIRLALLLLPPLQADSLRATVAFGPEGTRLLDAVRVPGAFRGKLPPAAEGAPLLEILDGEGVALAATRLPDPRDRAVVHTEGPGEGARLEYALLRVKLPWPEGARALRCQGEYLPPEVASPTAPPVGGDPEDPAARLDIVLLGDGYVAGEVDLFASDAETFAGHLLSLEPFDAYTGLVAFWRVDRPSSESGVSHAETTPPVMKETAYGCAYGCGGIDRLVCCDDGRVLDDIGTHTPWADGALVLVNDATYGGSGGWSYAVAYNGSEGPRVGAHELAHSLIGLWDEYSYGTTGRQGDGPNCAFSAGNPPWAHWLDEPGIGAFPECTYTNYFRPSEGECLMYALQDRWCPVCREHIVHGIYEQLPRLLLAVEPAEGEVLLAVEEDTRFSFTALGPDAGLTAEWRLDGALVGTDEVLALRGCGREAARLELRVHDPTLWVRVDPNGLLVDEAAWTLAYASCPAEPQETGEEPAKRRGEPPRACGCASSVPFEAWGLLLAMLPLLGRARRATRG